MISLSEKTHKKLVRAGYTPEQFVKSNLAGFIENFYSDSNSYAQIRVVRSEDAFRGGRYCIPRENKGAIIYAKYTPKEARAREGRLHEILVEIKDRVTNKTVFADLASLN